jgi:arabinosyltransferase
MEDDEAVPLHGAPTSSPARPSAMPEPANCERRRMRPARAVLAVCSACLALACGAAGLAMWTGTGRAVASRQVGARAQVVATPPAVTAVVPSKTTRWRGCVGAPANGQPPPSPHVAAAEWWFAMVSPYAAPARDAALPALRAQDAVEAAAAADRFACADQGPGTPAPGLAPDRALSPALLHALVGPPTPSRPIAVTWCNAAFVPFALNWAAHARAAGLEPFIIGASDPAALEALTAAGLPAFAMPGPAAAAAAGPADAGWGTPAFHALGRAKAALAAALTGAGYDALLCDVDTVWLADPRAFLARWPDAAVLTSWDGLHRTRNGEAAAASAQPVPASATGLAAAVAALALPTPPEGGGGGGLEAWPTAAAAPANICVVLWRAGAHPVAVAWRDALLAEPGAWDQDVFNDLLTAGGAPNGSSLAPSTASPGLFRAFGAAAPPPPAPPLLAGVLPVDTFASGHTHFVQRLAERTRGVAPFVVHTTFQFSGSAGKKHRLRERWLWAVDGPDHYAPRGGLVTLGAFEDDPTFGALLARAAPAPVPADDASAAPALAALAGHFALVHHQLRSVRAGLALAAALNRTLVLPRLWCGADRWWQPFTGGAIPGTAAPARLPFRCPADHVLDVAAMGDGGAGDARALDAAAHGPPIAFREAGLLENPRFPAAHRESGLGGTVTVLVGSGGGGGGGGGGGDGGAGPDLAIPAGLDDVGLRAALARVSAAPILHFPDPGAALAGFRDRGTAARLARRVAASTDLWCCVPGAAPGHVWYDAMADVDHVDRHGKRWRAREWAPTTGP